ncbi:MAG: ATP-binding cassette domain-containing protein [Anaerolineales bacterium]
MEPLIRIRNLRVQRGNHQALQLNSLDIQRGEVLAIVGPNGAGKSTLLLTLARLLQPAQGEIFFEERRLIEWNELEYRRRIALVFEQPFLMNASLLENVMLGLHFRGLEKNEARRRATHWLNQLGIGALAERRSNQL